MRCRVDTLLFVFVPNREFSLCGGGAAPGYAPELFLVEARQVPCQLELQPIRRPTIRIKQERAGISSPILRRLSGTSNSSASNHCLRPTNCARSTRHQASATLSRDLEESNRQNGEHGSSPVPAIGEHSGHRLIAHLAGRTDLQEQHLQASSRLPGLAALPTSPSNMRYLVLSSGTTTRCWAWSSPAPSASRCT